MGLMSDLASAEDISGDVYLYDIDYEVACHNEIIGNKFNTLEDAKSVWNYRACKTASEALTDADFEKRVSPLHCHGVEVIDRFFEVTAGIAKRKMKKCLTVM